MIHQPDKHFTLQVPACCTVNRPSWNMALEHTEIKGGALHLFMKTLLNLGEVIHE